METRSHVRGRPRKVKPDEDYKPSTRTRALRGSSRGRGVRGRPSTTPSSSSSSSTLSRPLQSTESSSDETIEEGKETVSKNKVTIPGWTTVPRKARKANN